MSPDPWSDARARLTAAFPAVPMEWPNEPFESPDTSDGTALWFQIEAVGDSLAPIEAGNGTWMEEGRFLVHVVVPVNTGSMRARTHAKWVTNAFRGIPPGPTVYYAAAVGAGDESEDGTVWSLTVAISWRYQDIGV